MSQFGFPDLESPTSGSTLINGNLEPAFAAIYSNHKGNARPSYVLPGMSWVDDTTNPWVVNYYDGASDVPIGTINTTTHQFTPSNGGTGDVTASASLANNAIVLGDGGVKGVKSGTMTGLLKAASGVVSAATAGTDYYAPGSADVAVGDGGTGRSSHTAYAVICGGTSTTAAQQSIASVGSSGQVLTSNGAGALPTMQAATSTGRRIQTVETLSSTYANGTTSIPGDNTTPQSGEGNAYASLDTAITPGNAANMLELDIEAYLASNGSGNTMTVILLQDAIANALAAFASGNATSVMTNIKGSYRVSAANTSSRTYKVKYGSQGSDPIYIGGLPSVALYNGTMKNLIRVKEYN